MLSILLKGANTSEHSPDLRQHSEDGISTLREDEIFIEHQMERESLAEGVRTDARLLSAIFLETIQIFIKRLLLRVLLLDQELDVVALLTLLLNHLSGQPQNLHIINKPLIICL